MVFAVSAAPSSPTQPHTSSSPLALIDRLLNYEKVERALVKLRGIFIAVCGPYPHHIYQNKNAFTQGKKIKSIESSKEQFFYSSQQPVLGLVPFSMGCWLLAVC